MAHLGKFCGTSGSEKRTERTLRGKNGPQKFKNYDLGNFGGHICTQVWFYQFFFHQAKLLGHNLATGGPQKVTKNTPKVKKNRGAKKNSHQNGCFHPPPPKFPKLIWELIRESIWKLIWESIWEFGPLGGGIGGRVMRDPSLFLGLKFPN